MVVGTVCLTRISEAAPRRLPLGINCELGALAFWPVHVGTLEPYNVPNTEWGFA